MTATIDDTTTGPPQGPELPGGQVWNLMVRLRDRLAALEGLDDPARSGPGVGAHVAAGVSVFSMSPTTTRAVLVELDGAVAQLEALRMTVLAHGDRIDVAADSAATSTTAWLAAATRTSRPAAHALVQLAEALDGPRAPTRTNLARGDISLEHARVITRAVAAMSPAAVAADPSLPARGEAHLLELARTTIPPPSPGSAATSWPWSTPTPPSWPSASSLPGRRPPPPGGCGWRSTTTTTAPAAAGSGSRPCTPRCSARRSTP